MLLSQNGVKMARIQEDLAEVLRRLVAVVPAARDAPYVHLKLDWVLARAGGSIAIIDFFTILFEESICSYCDFGCKVRTLGCHTVSSIRASASPMPNEKA